MCFTLAVSAQVNGSMSSAKQANNSISSVKKNNRTSLDGVYNAYMDSLLSTESRIFAQTNRRGEE